MNTRIDGRQIMTEQQSTLQQRKFRAVVTAWILGAIAMAIFVAFVLSGVLAE